jgi:hypothetical protein
MFQKFPWVPWAILIRELLQSSEVKLVRFPAGCFPKSRLPLKSLRKQFSQPLLERKASARIMLLIQNNSKISKYTVEFLGLAFKLDYDNKALFGQYISGLSYEIKKRRDSVFPPLKSMNDILFPAEESTPHSAKVTKLTKRCLFKKRPTFIKHQQST